MARAMQLPKAQGKVAAQRTAGKRSPSTRTAAASGKTSPRKNSSRRPEQRRSTGKPAVKKVTTRTSNDRQRVTSSPLARAVTQKNAPKTTRIFIYTTATLAMVTITLMMAVVIFQTRLAETQLKIDAIEQQISTERARYNELRLQRSVLREPSRLVKEASALGMVPGAKTNFTTIDPAAVASVLVSMSGLDLEQFANTREPLKNYSAVKALIGGGS